MTSSKRINNDGLGYIRDEQADTDNIPLTSARYGCALIKADRKAEYDTWREQRRQATTGKEPFYHDIQNGVVNGRAIRLARPPYPALARPKRLKTMVSVMVLINEQGFVINACAINSAPVFHENSEVAAYRSQFVPVLINDKPVKVTGIINYNYIP